MMQPEKEMPSLDTKGRMIRDGLALLGSWPIWKSHSSCQVRKVHFAISCAMTHAMKSFSRQKSRSALFRVLCVNPEFIFSLSEIRMGHRQRNTRSENYGPLPALASCLALWHLATFGQRMKPLSNCAVDLSHNFTLDASPKWHPSLGRSISAQYYILRIFSTSILSSCSTIIRCCRRLRRRRRTHLPAPHPLPTPTSATRVAGCWSRGICIPITSTPVVP